MVYVYINVVYDNTTDMWIIQYYSDFLLDRATAQLTMSHFANNRYYASVSVSISEMI